MTTIYLATIKANTKRSAYFIAEVDEHNMLVAARFPKTLDGSDISSFSFVCYGPFYDETPSHVYLQPAPELVSILHAGPVYYLLPKEALC